MGRICVTRDPFFAALSKVTSLPLLVSGWRLA